MPKTRPRLKIVRRFGIQLPGLTRKSAEKKPYPPGQHGQSTAKRRKTSEFRKLLEEKQKVRFNYGVSEGQLRRYMGIARKMPGKTGDNLLAVLERRLDNVVFRMGFAPTIPAARQLVSHGNVRVNGKRNDRPSYLTESGDEISLATGKTRERVSILETLERGPQLKLPSYVAMDPSDKFAGRVIGTPMRNDTPFPVNGQSIVEFYAR
ncbi:MAG TPA: 30S ribosomal protein S4 [Gemmatimonadaceae bacterium]|nr:30S ribosomal protein S4 [Gemmatimonadaceae bacterium]